MATSLPWEQIPRNPAKPHQGLVLRMGVSLTIRKAQNSELRACGTCKILKSDMSQVEASVRYGAAMPLRHYKASLSCI